MAVSQNFIYRKITNLPLPILLSICGLGLGLAFSFMSLLWINSELSYDKFHSDNDFIFRILTQKEINGNTTISPYTVIPAINSLKNDFPAVKEATFMKFESRTLVESGKKGIEILPVYTNESYFLVFDGFLFTEGSVENVLSQPNSVVLNEDIAEIFFGTESAIGKIVNVVNEDKSYVVSGVVRIPNNTHIHFDMITSIENHSFLNNYFTNNWERSEITTAYVRLHPRIDIAEFHKKIRNQLEKYGKSNNILIAQNLSDIHFQNEYIPALYDKNLGNNDQFNVFVIITIVIFLFSLVNYAFFNFIHFTFRNKEFVIRKINGASIVSLLKMVSKESLILCFSVTLISVLLVFLIIPELNKWFNIEIMPSFNNAVYISSVVVILSSIVLTIVVLFSFVISISFKRFSFNRIVSSRNKVLGAIVSFQFAITIVFMVTSNVISKQNKLISNMNLGLDHKNIVLIEADYSSNIETLKSELNKNPNVLSIASSIKAPLDFIVKGFIKIPFSIDSIEVSYFAVDNDFAKTYQIELLEGTFFESTITNMEKRNDIKESINNNSANFEPIVINSTAARLLNLNNPIGQKLGNFIIEGVVKDFNYQSIHHKIAPLIMTRTPRLTKMLNVKISQNNSGQTIEWICDTYKNVTNSSFVSYHTYEELLKSKYKNEIILKKLSNGVSMLSILISLLGVFAYSVILVQNKTKEVGIRKVNGATSNSIIVLLNKKIMTWILISVPVSLPISWILVNRWLENYAYKITIDIGIFIIPTLTIILLVLFSISFQIGKAANLNPVNTLKYE